ncbi:MAG: hypothetical protein L6Q66_11075 [Bacteroidia bacterium]|nr:hypothetical protein [Bacteroidia bacterium]
MTIVIFRLFRILIPSFLIIACQEPNLSEKGKEYLFNIDIANNCYEVVVNHGIVSNFKTYDEAKNVIVVKIRGCSGKLNYNEVSNNQNLIDEIAATVYNECLNKDKYSFVQIDFGSNSKDAIVVRFEYAIQNGRLTLKEKSTIKTF